MSPQAALGYDKLLPWYLRLLRGLRSVSVSTFLALAQGLSLSFLAFSLLHHEQFPDYPISLLGGVPLSADVVAVSGTWN